MRLFEYIWLCYFLQISNVTSEQKKLFGDFIFFEINQSYLSPFIILD